MGGIEESRGSGGLHADEVAVDCEFVSLVFVFAHTEVVSLDEFDELFAFDDTTCKLYFLAADLVQVIAEHGHNLTDFSIRGIIGQDDVFVPNELAFSGFDLLWSGEDMHILRKGAQREEAKDEKEFGFHCIRNFLQNCNKFQIVHRFYLKFTVKLQ